MKIGVLSDTHIPVVVRKLPQKIYDRFKDCDLIIHAGDMVEEEVLEELKAITETKAVQGNMDSYKLKKILPDKMIIEADGKRIGIIHGSGPLSKIRQTVSEAFLGKDKPDIIIYGHSHEPFNKEENGILFFNPGSPTDSVFAKAHTFGIITIRNGKIKAEIIDADE